MDSTTSRNRDLVAAIYRRYATGDVGAVLECLAEDAVWESESCSLPWSGRFDGAGVREYFARLGSAFEMRGYKVDRLIADGDWVVALATVRVRAHGAEQEEEFRKVDTMRFRDGQLVEFREYYDTARVRALLEG